MFNKDFYPTPNHVIQQMLEGQSIEGKVFLEPEAGKGDIVDYLTSCRAGKVLACETEPELRRILSGKCDLIGYDFLQLQSHEISHVDCIVMNPPFSCDERHILHAWQIAPAGCKIIALCNLNTLMNVNSMRRSKLAMIVDENGYFEDLGSCFDEAERKTKVKVALIKIIKPGKNTSSEFEGFFMDEDPEEQQANSIMPYNAVRDIVQRYVNAVNLFDKQMELAMQMNEIAGQFFTDKLSHQITENGRPKTRSDFKKQLQKSGWEFIFSKMNMAKYATKGLREDINSFVEKQGHIPFTMRNIYKMMEIVVGTTGSRMDKALMEVFDRVTTHYDENRFNVEGWKTNSHYLLNRRFIIPGCVSAGYNGEVSRSTWSYNNFELIEDLVKALCFLSGENYSEKISLENYLFYEYKLIDANGKYINDKNHDFDCKITGHAFELEKMKEYQKQYYGSLIESVKVSFGQWFTWGFFRVRAYKKGTLHIEFLDESLWARFNQRIAKLKGYPLYENVSKKQKGKPNEVALKETLA